MSRVLACLVNNGLESAYFYLATSVYVEAVELEGRLSGLNPISGKIQDTLELADYREHRHPGGNWTLLPLTLGHQYSF